MVIDFVQHNILWVGLAVVSGGMLLWPLISEGGGQALGPAEATLLMNRQDAVLLDVREASEFSQGHIAGARQIALAQLEKRMTEIEKLKRRPIIVCCATGSRASVACAQLKKAGFENVHSLAGGIAAWSAASLPLTAKG